jgi:hypothetical protein
MMKAIAGLAVCALLLQGCALGLVAAGAGGGYAGAQYLQPDDRTFTAPLDQVRTAAIGALDGLGMHPQGDEATADGRKLTAQINDRTVEVTLENMTYNTTRMSVVVMRNETVLRDHATAEEILQKTAQHLTGGTAPGVGQAPPPTE